MQPNQALATLKTDFFSPDSAVATAAADKLGELGGDEVVDFLISVLKSPDALQRNSAALVLRDIGDNRAAESLWREILNPQNRNRRATMVYALERMDCSQKLPELFDLLFYGSYEARMYAGTILEEQDFEFSEADLHSIQDKWNDLQRHPEKCPDFEACKEDIQHFVEGFMSYLLS